MPQTDAVKLITSHLVAAVLAIGGPLLLVWVFVNASQIDGSNGLIAIIAGFVGIAIQFLFQTNTQSAARAQTRNDLLENRPGG